MTFKNVTNSLFHSVDFISNNYGTIDSTHCSISNANELRFGTSVNSNTSISSSRTDGLSNYFNNEDKPIMEIIPIYRFKFTQDFMEELHQFSKIHYLDTRKDFKEAWVKWSEEEKIKNLIEKEVKRLHELGFHGDILDKMFKSARYYFRKREDNFNKKVVEDHFVSTRNYHCCSKYFLEIMDKQIKRLLLEKNMELVDKKPSIAFLQFCKENKDLLKEEIESLLKLGFTNVKEIQYKIKKTYKNKYFSVIHK
jgi:hypothetical protein